MTMNDGRDGAGTTVGERPVLHPLRFRSMELRNRVIRSSLAPAPDWERRFAQAGVGAIISACIEVGPDGDRPPLGALREHLRSIQSYLCRYIIQIGHATSPHQVWTTAEIEHVIRSFADAARWARESGADGVEIDGARGSLIAQFLGQSTGDRPGGYRGSLERRCRLAREIVQAVRLSAGPDLHVQIQLGATSPMGMMAAGTLHLVRWLAEDGIDAIHLAPDGDHPRARTGRSFAVAARFVKEVARVPVLRNGAFGTVDEILTALDDGSCDAVTLTRPSPPVPAPLGPGPKPRAVEAAAAAGGWP